MVNYRYERIQMSEKVIYKSISDILPDVLSMLEQPPLQFWVDFGNFIKATAKGDDSDERWEKLCKWADILMSRYNNRLANLVVRQYLDCLAAPDNDTT